MTLCSGLTVWIPVSTLGSSVSLSPSRTLFESSVPSFSCLRGDKRKRKKKKLAQRTRAAGLPTSHGALRRDRHPTLDPRVRRWTVRGKDSQWRHSLQTAAEGTTESIDLRADVNRDVNGPYGGERKKSMPDSPLA
uniref:Uncharacterized protein n=1 Tax=Ixodes ricinus TaxID=34613 RepID=A0A6B0US86_IXORI